MVKTMPLFFGGNERIHTMDTNSYLYMAKAVIISAKRNKMSSFPNGFGVTGRSCFSCDP